MIDRKMLLALVLASLASGCAPEPSPAPTGTTVPFSKQKIELSTGIDMAYLEAGNPGGDVVILLHGYTDTSRSWYPSMQRLAASKPELHIFALDQRGHGGSAMPNSPICRQTPEACFRAADFADDVLAFMDAKGISRADVAGHSMGSLVAQELAFTHPERLDRIVLVGTTNSGVGNVVLQDYVLAEPVEGSWKTALEAKGHAYPDDVYDLTPLDADPDVEAWMAANCQP